MFYTEASSQVLHNGKMNKLFSIHTSVKQECVPSTILFNIVLNDGMQQMASENNGLRWILVSYLQDVDMDDICRQSHTFDQI